MEVYMNFIDFISFAKVYNAAMNPQCRDSVSNLEIEVTVEILKKMADNRYDWSDEQKSIYKLLADYVKERIRDRANDSKEKMG